MTNRRLWSMTAAALVGAALAAGCSSTTASAPTSTAASASTAAPASTASPLSTAASTAPASTASSTAPATSTAAADQTAPGDIPDSQVFVAFVPASGGFTVKVPEGWARSDGPTGTVFSDKYNSVQIESRATAAAPTSASATSADLPALKAADGHIAGGKVSAVTRSGGPVVLIEYQTDSPVNQVTGKSTRVAVERYELWHAGTEVILTLSGAVGADNVDPWHTITDSLTWTT